MSAAPPRPGLPIGAGPPLGSLFRLQRVGAALAGPHPDDRLDRGHPDLAVADLPGAGGLDDDVDDLVHGGVVHDDLDPHLRHEVDRVLGAAVDLGVALLTAVTLHFTDRHTEHACLFQARLDVFERERFDDCG